MSKICTATEVIRKYQIEKDIIFNKYSGQQVNMKIKYSIEDINTGLNNLKNDIDKIKKILEPKKLSIIPNTIAEKLIRAFVDKKIKSKVFIIDDFEISEKLNIPIEQVDLVIEKLLKDGILYEQ